MTMMKTMKAIVVGAALLAAGAATAQAPSGDANRGRERVQMCQGCHGIAGWRTAFPEIYHVPKLAGQHAQYLAAALAAYKSGARSHPSMRAIAATLTEQEMADLAAYYAQASNAQPSTPAPKK